jgi:uncharacterized SAM-binding protein YcdF (DUF218 family)
MNGFQICGGRDSLPSRKAFKVKRPGLRAGLVVLVLLIVDLACTLLYLDQVQEYTEGLEQRRSEAAIVLFADFGRVGLGQETLRRVNFTARMFERGAFDHIVCAGGARPSKDAYGSKLMRDWFLAAGIPADRVFLEKRSYDTRSNLEEGIRIVRERGWSTAWLVSSPLHIFRIKETTQDPGGSLSLFPAAYSYRDCRPEMHRVALWLQTHYEWVSWLLQGILPARTYEKMVATLRG